MSETLGLIGAKLFPLNLTFEFNKTEIGTLLLDVLLTEDIEYDGEVTRYPVEDGSEISDHIMEGSKTIKISGTTSNAEAWAFNLSSGKARLISVLETMETLKKERKLITVTTALARYENMGLEKLRASRSNNSPRDGNWIDVTAELRRVQTVTLRTADVPAAPPTSGRTGATAARTNANANSANSASNAGQTSPASLTGTTNTSTIAKKMFNSLFGG